MILIIDNLDHPLCSYAILPTALCRHVKHNLFSRPLVNKLVPVGFPNENYHLYFTQGEGDKKEGELVFSRWL